RRPLPGARRAARCRPGRAGVQPRTAQPGRGLPRAHRQPGRGVARVPAHPRGGQVMRTLDIGSNTALRDAVAVTDRPERASALAATFTFAHRALLRIKHVPEQLMDVTMSPVIFT